MKRKLKLLSFCTYIICANILYANSDSGQALEIECAPTITVTEGSKLDSATTGWPKIINNTGGTITVSYFDVYSKGKCPAKQDQVTRFFTVKNSLGDQQRCTQIITVKHIDINFIRVPKDTTILYPLNNVFSALLLNTNQNLASVQITFKDSLLVKRCINPMRILRTWTVKDLCSPAFRTLTTNLTLNGYEDSFAHDVLSTDGVCNNDGSIELIAKGEFGPYNYKWNSGDSVATLYGKPAGSYQVIMTDRFNCPSIRLYFLQNIGEIADVGGRILTKNGYHVYPDSLLFNDQSNITNSCISRPQVLQYAFNLKKNNPGYYAYNFRKLKDPLVGTSTKDILLIQKHILGVQKFKDTLSIYAADALGNHNVAGSDIVEIRKLILGVIPNFTKVDPWAFIRTDYLSVITPNTTLKEIGFKGSNITLFPKQNIDVLVLKIGDVDFSYKGSNFQTDEADVRSQKNEMPLKYKIYTNADQTKSIDFFVENIQSIEGLQLSINFPSAWKIINSQIAEEFIYQTNDHQLNISWSTGELLSIERAKPLFTIQFLEPNKELNFSLSRRIDSEIYLPNGNDQALVLERKYDQEIALLNEFYLLPNPTSSYFTVQSKLEFHSLRFFSELGTELKVIEESKGNYNISGWSNGIYFYTAVLANGKQISGKLIVEK